MCMYCLRALFIPSEHDMSELNWITFERKLSFSRPPVQGEEDEVPGEKKGYHLFRNRIDLAVCH